MISIMPCKMSRYILWYLFFSISVYDNCLGRDSVQKRILVSDPSYVQTQIDHLRTEMQELQVKTDTQQSSIESHETTIINQQTTITNLKATISSQQTIISELEKNGKGVIFKRWGRKDCPTNFSMLYSGMVGGSWWNDPGSAVDYQCLPPDPTWGSKKNLQYGGHVGHMFGAEYENGWIDSHNQDQIDKDVPCSVCYKSSYSMVIMIPGKMDCYPGWTEAYHGDLASGYFNYKGASEYICVDNDPQSLMGGSADQNGKLLYHVQTQCGSLKCPPYENNAILSCVVCVK